LGASSGFNNSDDLSTRIAQSISGGNERINARLGVSGEQNEAFYDGAGDQIFIDNTQTDLQYNRTSTSSAPSAWPSATSRAWTCWPSTTTPATTAAPASTSPT
jgi:hypothetical protein